MRISAHARAIEPSLTLAVTATAQQLRAQGVDVIGFGAGEPDFDTPEHIKRAAEQALARGATKYTPVPGTVELRAAVAQELAQVHGIDFTPKQVMISCGAKHSLYNLFTALLDVGDEVIIPSPCWVSYPELVKMAGGTPVILPTSPDDGYQIDERALRAAMTPKTRAILLNSPCNPTGASYRNDTIEGVARALRDRANDDTYLITDDIYRRLTYVGSYVSIVREFPEVAERTIIVDGVSKAYAMTGWRIGYTAGPADLIEAMSNLQSQSTSNPAAVSQAAALAALTGPQDAVETMRLEFDRRRRAMIQALRAIDGVEVHEPEGAFYAFQNLSAFIGRGGIADDLGLAQHLLEVGHIALVPGSGFLAPGFARLSYATSMSKIEEGLRRLKKTLETLT